MAKHQPYSRHVLRALRADWRRRNRGFLAIAYLILFGLLVGLTVWTLVFGRDSRAGWYVTGLAHGALICTFLYGLHTAFLLTDRDGIRQLRGAWGEENTRSELAAAKRRRLVWDWVDSISLDRGDIDHVVITRRAGLVVLDSKWRNQSNAQDVLDMAASARRVKLRAEGIARSILASERHARHRARIDAVQVRPAVVIWGAQQRELPDGSARVDGIDFVAGRNLHAWLRQLDGEPVSRHAARDLVRLLKTFRATTSERQLQRRT
jgi:hypothetical protein